jgi:hypothetical protein
MPVLVVSRLQMSMTSGDAKAPLRSDSRAPARTRWAERLTPALSESLLSDLIGVIADYAASLRWSATAHAPRIRLSDPLDEDGCSRTIEGRHNPPDGVEDREPDPMYGWNSAMSDSPIGELDCEPGGQCVRWAFRMLTGQVCALGVARADATLWPAQFGTDANSWAVYIDPGAPAQLGHGGCEVASLTEPVPSSATGEILLTCTADLQADRLTFSLKCGAEEVDMSALSVSVPRLGECFAYAATGPDGCVTLILGSERPAMPAMPGSVR